MANTCATCFFSFVAPSSADPKFVGKRCCNFNAPAAVNNPQALPTAWMWPIVQDDWFCGDGADASSGQSFSSPVNLLPSNVTPTFLIAAACSFTTSGANNDVAVTTTHLLVTAANNMDTISGFIPSQLIDGALLLVENKSDSNLNTMKLVSAGSTSGYRVIIPPGDTDITLFPGWSMWLIFRLGFGWYPYRPGQFA